MIIGNGLIGKTFRLDENRYNDYVMFVSGVSDSKCTDINAYNREVDLITKTIDENINLTFVYVSTILSDVIDNDYYRHKLRMEKLIQEKSKKFIVFRVPQIIGINGNSNNLFNHLINNVKMDKENIVFDGVERSIVDVEDLKAIIDYCIERVKNEVVNFSFIEKISVLKLCEKINYYLNKKNKILIKESPTNQNWSVDNSEIIKEAIVAINITENYIDKIIIKYINK